MSSSASDRRQAVGVTFGGFFLKGRIRAPTATCCSRTSTRWRSTSRISTARTISGEWLVGLGDYLEAGFSAGYYQQTVPSVYREHGQRERLRDRAGAETAHRAAHRDGAVSADRPCAASSRTSAPASVHSTGATARPASSSTSTTTRSSGRLRRRRHGLRSGDPRRRSLPVRRHVGRRRRTALPVGRRRHQARRSPACSADKIDLGGWNAAVTFHVRF